MKILLYFVTFLFFQGCINRNVSEKNNYAKLRTIDINSVELSMLNDKIDSSLVQSSSDFKSSREFIESLVRNLDTLEWNLIDFTGGIKGGGSYFDFYNAGDHELTQDFFKKNDFANSRLAVQTIRDFDSLNLTEKTLEEMLLSMMIIFDDRDLSVSLFDELSLEESIELIQIIKKRILLAENEYLTNEIVNER